MVILGIDPGSGVTGYGVIRAQGSRMEALDYGCIRGKDGELPSARYVRIFQGLQELFARVRPETAAIESVFFCKNARSAIKLGEARGVAILAAGRLGIPIYEYEPRRVKQAVVGFGGAHKSQVQSMVVKLLGLKVVPKPEDVTDALAVAICHLHAHKNILEKARAV